MAWTVLWMTGLSVTAGAIVFDLAGPTFAVAAVGITMVVHGVVGDLHGLGD